MFKENITKTLFEINNPIITFQHTLNNPENWKNDTFYKSRPDLFAKYLSRQNGL